MERDSASRRARIPFPLSKVVDNDNFRYYYAYGNTPAEDLLRSVVGEKEPSVLLLGCGDMRSCFYTLWKHFSSYSKSTTGSRFDGVRFVLNDRSAAVLARNILLLYLAVGKIPSDNVRKLCAMWAIWFCHELYPEHKRLLKEALAHLLKVSVSTDTWSGRDHVLKNMVRFDSPSTLVEVRRMWAMWLMDDFGEVGKLSLERKQFLEHSQMKMISTQSLFALTKCMEYKCFDLPIHDEVLNVMKEDIVSYINRGSAFAERALGLKPGSQATAVNPTFFERLDHSYSLHYTSLPFDCFYQAIEFSEKSGISKQAFSGVFKVNETSFQETPFLANSVQQFAVWVQAVQDVLQPVFEQAKPGFTFQMFHSDALHFCQQMKAQPSLLSSTGCAFPLFDTIHSSNLIDSIPLPSLALSALSLLKTKGILFTTTFKYRAFAATPDQYLKALFGFDCELLPLISGIVCLGQEGRYTDPYSTIYPTPTSLNASKTFKILMWQKSSGLPLKVSTLKDSQAVQQALYQCFCTASAASLWCENSKFLLYDTLCSETALQVVLSFISQLGEGVPMNRFQFWEGLCFLIQSTDILKPFLVHIQTQALLHDIHLHLTLSESTCPHCNGKPLATAIAQYSTIFNPMVSPEDEPQFLLLIHKEQDQSIVQFVLGEAGLQTIAQHDVHIVDSFFYEPVGIGKERRLDFFLPTVFVVKEYYLTVSRSKSVFFFGKQESILTAVHTTRLSSITSLNLNKSNYHFTQAQCNVQFDPVPSPFGTISLHVGNRDEFKTHISLCENVAHAMMKCQDELRLESSTEFKIKVLCHEGHLTLQYPCPVDYKSSKVKWSMSEKLLAVHAPRKACRLWTYQPVFVATPDNQFCFPSVTPHKEMYSFVDNMQYTMEDYDVLMKAEKCPSLKPLKFRVKETFKLLLHSSIEVPAIQFENEMTKEILGLLMFENNVFDLENNSHALDIYFHLRQSNSPRLILHEWSKVLNKVGGLYKQIFVDEEEMRVLSSILISCATRTRGSLHKHHSTLLEEHKILHRFSRAVIYPLYAEPDISLFHQNVPQENLKKQASSVYSPSGSEHHQEKDIQSSSKDLSSATTTSTKACKVFKCDFCHAQSSKLKKCSHCRTAIYCNEDCQRNHWKKHRLTCRKKGPAAVVMDKEVKMYQLDSQEKHSSVATVGFEEQSQRTRMLRPLIKDSSSEEVFYKDCSSSTSPKMDTSNHQACSFCLAQSAILRKCSRCGRASYCSKKCQSHHWKQHQLVCEKRASSPVDIVPTEPTPCTSSQNIALNLNETKEAPSTYSSDITASSSPGREASNGQSCDYCHFRSCILKKCTRCGKASYCNKDCQSGHWKQHKLVCCEQIVPSTKTMESVKKKPHSSTQNSPLKERDSTASEAQSCGFCHSQSFSLKPCSRCKKASYCSMVCQSKHWGVHKQVCQMTHTPRTPVKLEEQELLTNAPKPAIVKGEVENDNPSSSPGIGSHKTKESKSQSCDFCHSRSLPLKACTHCKKALYCSKVCQRIHWKEHQSVCVQSQNSEVSLEYQEQRLHTKVQLTTFEKSSSNQVDKSIRSSGLSLPGKDALETCDFCHSQNIDLKKCTHCKRASYCSKLCQRKHWKEHQPCCLPTGAKATQMRGDRHTWST